MAYPPESPASTSKLLEARVVAAPVQGRVERVNVQPGEQVTMGTGISNPKLEQTDVNAAYQVKAAEAEHKNLQVRLNSDRMTLQAATASV